ncbi:MAG: GNAT family N-acetyltransferase [Cyclobacteriaceae bacterium]|nr:GNAT family N-acetyltransferase [Cyclobacteriaceae bacterium]
MSSIKYTIRQATPSDKPILLQFEQGVIEAERPYDPTLTRENTIYYDIDEMIRAPHIELLVAEVNGKLAGCGYARIESSKQYLQHRQHAYLGFMYVTPEHRGKGINQKIIEALKDWAVGQGVHELRLEVYVQNESAIKAYEKIGFVRHMYEMRKSAL